MVFNKESDFEEALIKILSEKGWEKEVLKNYSEQDLLNCKNVRVYQLQTQNAGKTEIKELLCGKNGFAVPTFNNALNVIMNEAYEIQG